MKAGGETRGHVDKAQPYLYGDEWRPPVTEVRSKRTGKNQPAIPRRTGWSDTCAPVYTGCHDHSRICLLSDLQKATGAV